MIKQDFNLSLKQLECDLIIDESDNFYETYCPARWDGWSCWPSTKAGEIANQSCPSFILGFDSNRTVFYTCEENGQWYVKPETNQTWADYTHCVNLEDYLFRNQITLIQQVGYSVSLVALLLSLFLLAYFKSLRCARITVHMNLFASFAVNNFFWLMWYTFVLEKTEVLMNNTVACRILYNLVYTFLISTYSWMLCEGLYLHTVLVSAFISEVRLLRYMLILGWGIPLLTILIYAPSRAIFGGPEDHALCWMEEGKFNIILQIPVGTTMLLNVVFLINIVRVLLIKLRRGPANDGSRSGASRATLQALRATLLLVPLLGLNFLLTPFRPAEKHPWEHAYEVVSAITASMQGFCVAILFCFCNGEVIAQVKRKWRTIMFRPRANSCTVTTVSFVRTSYPATNGEEKV